MNHYEFLQFGRTMKALRRDILEHGESVNTSQWNSTKENTDSVELPFVTINYAVPNNFRALMDDVLPNLPWAEDHFRERVGGEPVNPPPSAAWWPFARADHAQWVADGGKFSHSYPERMWSDDRWVCYGDDEQPHVHGRPIANLSDLINLMRNEPGTRQAFLPIWWPIDGIMAGVERVPCTLGYHFIERDGMIHCNYFMRSCDYMRYLRDDLYLTARLLQWVAEELGREPGMVRMNITSLHIFKGDVPILRNMIRNEQFNA